MTNKSFKIKAPFTFRKIRIDHTSKFIVNLTIILKNNILGKGNSVTKKITLLRHFLKFVVK